MGWRENMGILNSISQEQKPQKEQKPQDATPFATIAAFATKNPKLKISPPPDLSKIKLTHHREYKSLWYRAWKLADYIDGEAPYQDRIAKLPEYDDMIERLGVLECQGQKTNKG